MGFFKNIGIEIRTVEYDDEPKIGEICKININGTDYIFDTKTHTAGDCGNCVFFDMCIDRLDFGCGSKLLIINGKNLYSDNIQERPEILRCLCTTRSDNNNVIFTQID